MNEADNSLKILHILDHSLPEQTGYSFRAHSVITAQRKMGIEAMAVTSPKHYESRPGIYQPLERVGGIAYHRAPASKRSVVPVLSELRQMAVLASTLHQLAHDHRVSVFHPHSPTLNAIPAIWVGKRRKIPVVYEMRSSWEDAAVDRGTYGVSSWKYRLSKRLETWVCKNADAVVVICEGLKRELIGRGIPHDKITVVQNGVDVEVFDSSRRQESGVPLSEESRNRKMIGFMGSFFRWEGLELLIEAMARLTKMRSDTGLLLVGGGEMVAELRAKVQQLNLGQHVVMPGQVSQAQIPALYAKVDIMAFPRHSTKLTEMVTPLKPLEAMAMGKPIVASDVGGHKELIQHEETGLLFRAGDVDALVAQLCRCLDNEDLRRLLGKQGSAWVRSERSWDKTTRPYAEVYACLCP
ncbi:MAG: glycosyltransferase, exosortase A system-associated [Nitrospira sp.]|nr:glycosyltransferase, exosortase A system-associated [Nitrospira sp.]